MEGVFASLGGILELVYYNTTQKIVEWFYHTVLSLTSKILIDAVNLIEFSWMLSPYFVAIHTYNFSLRLSWKCGRAHFHRVYFLHNHVNFLEASFTNMKWNETKKKQMI